MERLRREAIISSRVYSGHSFVKAVSEAVREGALDDEEEDYEETDMFVQSSDSRGSNERFAKLSDDENDEDNSSSPHDRVVSSPGPDDGHMGEVVATRSNRELNLVA